MIATAGKSGRANERKEIRMARRRYQQGCVFKRGKNWVLRYREDVLNPDGTVGRTHRSVSLGHFCSKHEVWRAAESYLRKTNDTSRRPRTTITLHDFWSIYFAPEILPTLKFSTQKLYHILATKHLLPALGCERLCDIARVQIQQFIGQKQRQGYSPQTLAHFRNLLSKLFGTAMDWGWMDYNPAHNIKLPPMERRRAARVLTTEEIGKLAVALRDPSRMIFILGVTTGLRVGELLGLQVNDVDFSAAALMVRRTVYRGQVGTPKTRHSERRIPLPVPVIELLKQYLTIRQAGSGWLFPSDAGTPLDDRNLIRRQVEPISDRLGIRRFSWHALRHTFSTLAGNLGTPLPLLQSLLGHTSSETTMVYTHPLEAEKRQAVENLARVLFPNVPTLGRPSSGDKVVIQ